MKPTLTLSRKTINKPPAPESSFLAQSFDDDSVDFMEIRRATIALKAVGLYSNPELVCAYVGKLMDIKLVKEVLEDLERD
jgi:hypothetical protein